MLLVFVSGSTSYIYNIKLTILQGLVRGRLLQPAEKNPKVLRLGWVLVNAVDPARPTLAPLASHLRQSTRTRWM